MPRPLPRTSTEVEGAEKLIHIERSPVSVLLRGVVTQLVEIPKKGFRSCQNFLDRDSTIGLRGTHLQIVP